MTDLIPQITAPMPTPGADYNDWGGKLVARDGQTVAAVRALARILLDGRLSPEQLGKAIGDQIMAEIGNVEAGGITDSYLEDKLTDPTSAPYQAFASKFVPNNTKGHVDLFFEGLGGVGAGQTDQTPHITLQSRQSPHNSPGVVDNIGGYGQGIRLDVLGPLAKNVIAWRGPENPALPFDPDTNPLIDKVWVGWHHQHVNDDGTPGSVTAHQHWSVETPDENGVIQTRFQIKTHDVENGKPTGLKVTRIITTAADLVHVSSEETGAAFRHVGVESAPTSEEWSTTQAGLDGKRWALETDGVNMAKMALRRYAGRDKLGRPVYVFDRASGQVAFGIEEIDPNVHMLVSYGKGDRIGIHVASESEGDNTGATFQGSAPNSAHCLIRGRLRTESLDRFRAAISGELKWGSGAAAPDTNLYRHSAGRLKTDGDLNVEKNIRLGVAGGSGNAEGALIMTNAPKPPTATFGGGGILYTEGGALKFRGGNGTVTTIAPA